MKRLGCLVLALVLALALTGCGEPAQAGFFAMDTYMTVTAYGPGAQDAVTACGIHINALERDISRTISGSDVDVLNTAHAADLAPDTDILLALAQEYSAVTGGAFDITVAPLVSLWNVTGDTPHVASEAEIAALLPYVGSHHLHLDRENRRATLDEGCAIDLGGIGKGYASDLVKNILVDNGVKRATAALGGNVMVMGGKGRNTPWTVGIQDPADPEGYATLLDLYDGFVVTSGGYQRYFTAEDGTVYQHIIDPATGAPAVSDLTSVTIVAGSGTLADAFSTALYVMGEADAVAFWRGHQADYPFDMILITADGRLLYTPGLALTAPEGCPYTYQSIE